jgi:hypothetical protein
VVTPKARGINRPPASEITNVQEFSLCREKAVFPGAGKKAGKFSKNGYVNDGDTQGTPMHSKNSLSQGISEGILENV